MGIREFKDEEINELSTYVLQSIEYSELGRASMHLYNNEDTKTVKVFLLSYKILNSAANFASNPETKQKVMHTLNEAHQLYHELSRLFNVTKTSTYSSGMAEDKMHYLIDENSLLINEVIELINILSKKQSLVNLDRITGIRRDTTEGQELYTKFRNEIEESI